jgi:hypothetical protein
MASYRLGWLVAAWSHGGIPDWREVEASILGRPRKARTPQELLEKIKAMVPALNGMARARARQGGQAKAGRRSRG